MTGQSVICPSMTMTSCADPAQQVADDREGNSHAEPYHHGEKSFMLYQSLNSLKVYCHDLSPTENSVIGLSVQINGVSPLMFGHRATDGQRLKLITSEVS
jgi:hypothetical protein